MSGYCGKFKLNLKPDRYEINRALEVTWADTSHERNHGNDWATSSTEAHGVNEHSGSIGGGKIYENYSQRQRKHRDWTDWWAESVIRKGSPCGKETAVEAIERSPNKTNYQATVGYRWWWQRTVTVLQKKEQEVGFSQVTTQDGARH